MRIDEVEGPNKLAGLIKEKYKNSLTEAYDGYKNEGKGYTALILLVGKFAEMKLKYLEFADAGFAGVGTADTVDDWAQRAVIKIEKAIAKGGIRNLYAFCNRVCFNIKKDFFNDLKRHKDERVPLTTEQKDDDGEMIQELNPEVFQSAIRSDYLSRRFRSVPIPPEVQGVDRMICLLLLSRTSDGEGNERGRTYAEIGRALRMSEDAVAKRMSRLNERMAPVRARKEQERLERRKGAAN